MSNDGTFFDRDVNVYYCFSADGRLLDLDVQASDEAVWDKLHNVNQERQ